MSRKEGEFTLLLDDRFHILWYSESLCRMLGWGDVTGRNGTEFVHPDDLALVLEAIARARSGDQHKGMDPAFAPEAAEIPSQMCTARGIRSRPRPGTIWTVMRRPLVGERCATEEFRSPPPRSAGVSPSAAGHDDHRRSLWQA